MTAPLPTPDDVAHMGERHVREVLDVHPGYGEEAWCPTCRVHWPCDAARLLALVDSLIEERDTWQRRRGQTEKRWRRAEARLAAVLDLVQPRHDGNPVDGPSYVETWLIRRAANGERS